jgi:hypothetical protein
VIGILAAAMLVGIVAAAPFSVGSRHLAAAADDTTAVLVLNGWAFSEGGVAPWSDPDTLSFTNIRNGLACHAVIGNAGPGMWAATLVDWNSSAAAVTGDSLEVTLPDTTLVPTPRWIEVSHEAVGSGILTLQIVIRSTLSQVEDDRNRDRPLVRLVPNPAPGGRVRVEVYDTNRLDAAGSTALVHNEGRASGMERQACIYSPLGRVVCSLPLYRIPGGWIAQWDGEDQGGRAAPAGVYLVRVDGRRERGRLVVVR